MKIIIDDEYRKQEQTSLQDEKSKNDAGSAPSSLVTGTEIEPTSTIEQTVSAASVIDAGPVPQSLMDSIQGSIPPANTINNKAESNAGAAPEF